jgi:glycosyltransferase involved in cell wall biosynthesis
MSEFLFVAVGLIPQEAVTGGDMMFREMASRLLAQGHRVTILTSLDGKNFCQSAGLNAEYVLIERASRKRRPSFIHTVFIELKRMASAVIYFLRAELRDGTVVFATSDLIWEVLPVLAGKGKNITKTFSFHMIAPNPFRGYRGAFATRVGLPRIRESLYYLQQRLAIAAMKLARCRVLAHLNTVPYLIRRGIDERRIVGAILAGVDTARVAQARRGLNVYDACWIGRYHPQKGCEDLIDVWEIVCRAVPSARLVIMGRVEDELRPMVARRKLDRNVQFLGVVEEEAKFTRMSESKLFIYPSYYEGFPVTLCEALACGLPVVAYDLPLYREYFRDGVVTVPVGDKEALAHAVVALLHAEPRRVELGAEARRAGTRFDWDRVVDALLAAAQVNRPIAHGEMT